MTTPTPAGNQPSAPGNPSGSVLPVRSLTAWALLALAAVIVLFAFLRWIFPPFPHGFTDRFSVTSFANTTVLVAPLLAMLVATKIGPALRNAKLMGMIALATYGAALLFGVVSFLVTIAEKFDVEGRGAYYAFGYILQGLGDIVVELLLLGLLALAALWTYKIFVTLGGRLPVVNVQTD
jgi:hypothetical protein